MAHTNQVLIVRVDGQEFVKGDEFYPQLTEKIMDAKRLTTMADAKKYVKTAAKRLKMPVDKLKIIQAEETRDDQFQLVDVKLI